MDILIKKVSAHDDLQKCLALRKTVFVQGQNVPLHEELDGKDEISDHYLLYVNSKHCGTARIRFIDDYAKIERVAILDEFRGKGLGIQLMQQILADLKNQPAIKKAKLSSQLYAVPFYAKLGFHTCSEEYMDAGIPHKDMILELS